MFQILNSTAGNSLGLSVAFMAAVLLVGFLSTPLPPLSLLNLHIISWKEAKPPMALPYPPTFVHLNITKRTFRQHGGRCKFRREIGEF